MQKLFPVILSAAGIFGILVGLAIIVISVGPLRAKVADGVDSVQRVFSEAEQSLTGIEKKATSAGDALKHVTDLAQTGQEIVSQLPETAIALKGVLLQGSNAMDVTARTVRSIKTKTGLIGDVVLPEGIFQKNAAELERLAIQLRLAGTVVEKMGDSAAELERNSTQLAQSIPTLSLDLNGARTQLASARSYVDSLALPWLAAGLGIIFGALYLLLGTLCLAMARVEKRSRIIAERVPTPRPAERPRAA